MSRSTLFFSITYKCMIENEGFLEEGDLSIFYIDVLDFFFLS